MKLAEEIKPIHYSTEQEAVADANEVWVRNMDTLVAKAILENNITDVTRIILIQQNTLNGTEWSIRIKQNETN